METKYVFFRCGLEDYFITDCPKIDTSDKKFTGAWKILKFVLIEKKIDKMSENSTDQSDLKKM